MASVRQEIVIARSAADVWDALADVGALHTRLVQGFVVDCRLEGDARIVTFANGMVAREVLVDVDPDARRVAWGVVGTTLTHHNASAQAFEEGTSSCRVVWIADFLPNEAKARIAGMIELGLAAMKRTLEGSPGHEGAPGHTERSEGSRPQRSEGSRPQRSEGSLPREVREPSLRSG